MHVLWIIFCDWSDAEKRNHMLCWEMNRVSSDAGFLRICLCGVLLRHNWHRQRHCSKLSLIGPFIGATWEEAHFSRGFMLLRKGNKYWISLHERREIEIWIGVAKTPASATGAFGCGGWNVFSVYVCVSVWLMQTGPASNVFFFFLSLLCRAIFQ